MADLEPGVVFSLSTVAAMERLSTPSRTAMTEQHQAAPELWAAAEKWGANTMDMANCILELRARVEALEATQHAHVDTSRLSETVRNRIRQELSWPAAWQPHKVATETTYGTAPDAVPSLSAGSLVATDAELCRVYNEKTTLRAVYDLGRQHGAVPVQPAPEPSPAGLLVERVGRAIEIEDGPIPAVGSAWTPEARAAILEVAAWLREQDDGLLAFGLDWATRLQREANR